MDVDVLFTILFWAAGLCFLFWAGLALAVTTGQETDDYTDADLPETLAAEVYRVSPNAGFRAPRGRVL